MSSDSITDYRLHPAAYIVAMPLIFATGASLIAGAMFPEAKRPVEFIALLCFTVGMFGFSFAALAYWVRGVLRYLDARANRLPRIEGLGVLLLFWMPLVLVPSRDQWLVGRRWFIALWIVAASVMIAGLVVMKSKA